MIHGRGQEEKKNDPPGYAGVKAFIYKHSHSRRAGRSRRDASRVRRRVRQVIHDAHGIGHGWDGRWERAVDIFGGGRQQGQMVGMLLQLGGRGRCRRGRSRRRRRRRCEELVVHDQFGERRLLCESSASACLRRGAGK